MTRSPVRALVALAPLLVALVPMTGSAGATAGDAPAGSSPAGLAARAFAERPSASGVHATAAAEGTASATDPTGDASPADARADITAIDVTYDPATTLRVHADVAQTTDPETDAAWNRTTGLVWALDTDGDGEPDFGIALAKQGVAVVD